jgi:excisionase family DNA binding protein
MGKTDERILLTIMQTAHRLNVGRTTVFGLIRDGQLRVVRIGRAVRIPVSDVDAWLASQLAS